MIAGANPRSAEIRQARAQLRRGLAAGTLTLAEVLDDVPDCIAGVMLFELVTWRRGWKRDKVRRLGAAAIADKINLAIAAGDASRRTLDWIAQRDRETGPYQRGRHFHHRGRA